MDEDFLYCKLLLSIVEYLKYCIILLLYLLMDIFNNGLIYFYSHTNPSQMINV